MAHNMRDLEESMRKQVERAISEHMELRYETVTNYPVMFKTAGSLIALAIPFMFTNVPQLPLSAQIICVVSLLIFVRLVFGSLTTTQLTAESQERYMKFVTGALQDDPNEP